MEAPELEKHRAIIETYNARRIEEQREIARAIRARNEELYKDVVGLVMWAKGAGYGPAEIMNSMGVSRTTQVNYAKKWKEWYGDTTYEEIHGATARKGEPDKVELPEGMTVKSKMEQVTREGDESPTHEFWDSRGMVGIFEPHRGEKSWYDNLGTGVFGGGAPQYAIDYDKNWRLENE